MFKTIKSFFDDNAKDIKKYEKRVEEINGWESEICALSDAELKGKTAYFKAKLAAGATLDHILPEAFAVVRETSKRVLSMRHFDVQLIGGMVLHDGRISEMKTGEGKTLVATLSAYLNALTNKGVHIITVNDYLARRDSEWMGQIYRFLGLEVGLNVHGLDAEGKHNAYSADITYGTNNEFGFDYLRDNMAVRSELITQKSLYYAIIDEVDSILIDEARTPLIISGQAEKPTEHYYTVAKLIPRLKPETDYTVEEKDKAASLTEEGCAKMEKLLGLENLYDDENTEWSHLVAQALKAKTLFRRDRDYVVKDGEVIIVDEFTGRLMFGRRYSDGLHQALEAKEGVKIERESQTLATITFQNYFRMYEKLSGMTGTAKTEEGEFTKIYHIDVVQVPPNKEMIREDRPDVIYRTMAGKQRAIVDAIAEAHEKGQPVLVGTVSIEKSEILSRELKKRGIKHNVLNAKFHEMEAEIISQAGALGAVTIATNMAGRGTDILLGGNPEFLAKAELKAMEDNDKEGDYPALLKKYKDKCEVEKEAILTAGGLFVLGTERHESRRIDNQLRGRSGRQGDPGKSRFFLSMEDDLMRLFGSANMAAVMDKFGIDDEMPIDSAMVSKSLENAQKKVENNNFDMRKHVLEYDDVMNNQREVIYGQRREVLLKDSVREQVLSILHNAMDRIIDSNANGSRIPEEWDLEAIATDAKIVLPHHMHTGESLALLSAEEIKEQLHEDVDAAFAGREEELGKENMENLSRFIILRVVDQQWMDHLDAMDQLRQGIGLRAYGQKDPLVEYKFEAFDMFQEMIYNIQREVSRYVMRVNVVERPKEAKITAENRSEGEAKVKKPVRKENTVGRNDPCPCGSGKKYKKCCGQNK